MTNALLIEDGVLGNGETYRIRRTRPFNVDEEYPYHLHLDNGDVELFRTMIHAQTWVEGYATGKETFVKTRTRVNV